MVKVLIIYDSKTGNTEEMAKAIAEGIKEAKAEVDVKKAQDTSLEDMEKADALILGSPTHFGTMSEKMKKLISDSVKIRGKLEGKIGAAFTSSHAIAGGNETTLMSLIQAMLIHGMVIVGDPLEVGGHYGVVAIGKPNAETLTACKALGERVAELAAKIAG